MNQPRQIVNLNAPDPLVLRLQHRAARKSHPAQTMHAPVLLIGLACAAALWLAVAAGFVTLPGVGR